MFRYAPRVRWARRNHDGERRPVWIFERADDAIVLSCSAPRELTVSGRRAQLRREFRFRSVDERLAFQSGFENHLLETGWSLASFTSSVREPDRVPQSWWRRLIAFRPRRKAAAPPGG